MVIFINKYYVMDILKDRVTIVIPSKNEEGILYTCLYNISKQVGINGVRVIISDSSDSISSRVWINKAIVMFSSILDIEVIVGGYPSKARYEGSKLVKTPYVLFLDSDIMLKDTSLLIRLTNICRDMITCTIHTDIDYNWVYRVFNFIQGIGINRGEYFAVGGFQLWDINKYWEVGGFDETDIFAEDYVISRKLGEIGGEMSVIKTDGVYTSSRRFENKGILYMFRMMFLSYINRHNAEFFKQSHNYWV
jgi:glycosyltransferase involved in cell wall biosynthesis